MKRLLYALFAVVLATVAALILGTSGALPERVASHFALGGRPNAWMTHDFYVIFIVGVGVALPVFVMLALAWLPRFLPNLVNVPNRDYWLAAPQREATLHALSVFGCLVGMLIALFVLAIHLLTVNANLQEPPRLDESLLFGLVFVFVGALVVIIVAVFVRFRKMPAGGTRG